MKTVNTDEEYRNFKFFQNSLNSILLFSILLLFSAGCGSDDKDENPPPPPPKSEISILAQDLNVTITDPLTKLSYEITSVYDIKIFQVKINNIDRTELATLNEDILEIQPTPNAMLPSDYLITTLILKDDQNYSYTEKFTYDVDFNVSIAASFTADPQTGYAPTTVTFSPKVSAEESIQLYHWDFGDGTKNDSNTSRENLIGSPVKHTYQEAGEYTAVLTIYDSKYQPASSELIVRIINRPPVVTSLEVSPSNGALPLKSRFSASAKDNEGIREFLWDFNSDGQIDFNDSKADVNNKWASSSYDYTYNTVGSYQATLTIIDIYGERTTAAVPTISVLVGSTGTPSVTASAYPTSGKAPLTVSFKSSYGSFAKWEWDFDGDGVYDHSSTTTGSIDHNYTVAGTYFAKLQVTGSDGLASSDNIQITVDQDITLTRDTDTIEIKKAEAATLGVTMAAKAECSLVIENSRYEPIITLLEQQERSGTFSVSWDGTDNQGSIVPGGDYYAVLLYQEGDTQKRFDLRDERDNRDVPIETNIDAGDVFAPYLAPLAIEFNLTEASEVSLDIGPDGSSVTERIKTMLQNQPLGKGFYRFEWAGDANDGTLADLSLYRDKYPNDADYYMTGGFKNRLADNAIFVKSGVSVTNLSTDAPVYVPNAIGDDGKRKKLGISFELSSAAAVTLSINDAKTGAVVMAKQISSLSAGSQLVHWDGKNEKGKYIAPGVYRLGIKAKDSLGYTSLTQYALQRIFY